MDIKQIANTISVITTGLKISEELPEGVEEEITKHLEVFNENASDKKLLVLVAEVMDTLESEYRSQSKQGDVKLTALIKAVVATYAEENAELVEIVSRVKILSSHLKTIYNMFK